MRRTSLYPRPNDLTFANCTSRTSYTSKFVTGRVDCTVVASSRRICHERSRVFLEWIRNVGAPYGDRIDDDDGADDRIISGIIVVRLCIQAWNATDNSIRLDPLKYVRYSPSNCTVSIPYSYALGPSLIQSTRSSTDMYSWTAAPPCPVPVLPARWVTPPDEMRSA